MDTYLCIAPSVKLGQDVKLSKFINLYGCEIGDETKIGAFVEIQKNARVGKNCKISSHTFVCEGVTIEDNVFVGHGVMFINDIYPRATDRRRPAADRSRLEGREDAREERRFDRVGCTILANVTHWRKRDCRCRQRGDQRRSTQQHRVRKSSKSSSLY